MIQRYLILWLSLLAVLAYAWPLFAFSTADPFQATRPLLSYLIALIMFAVGCLLPRDELHQLRRRWTPVLYGTLLQYSSMPLLAYLSARWFQTAADFRIGLVLVGCVPGAMASNVLTLLARGNVSYSVSLTASATLCSPLIVPIALYLALHADATLDAVEVFWRLLREVVGPVVAGHLLCRRSAWLRRQADRWASWVANCTILWIIAVVVALNRDNLGQINLSLLLALAAINLGGYAAGYLGAGVLGLPEAMRRALTLEIGMQNAGLGTVLALTLFPQYPAAAIPPAFYTFGCMFSGTALAQYWAGRETAEVAK